MVIKETTIKEKWLGQPLNNVEPNDWIIINDIDEIPKLKKC